MSGTNQLNVCGSACSVKSTPTHCRIVGLYCGCWSCDDCAEENRLRLIAQAKAGEPTNFVTLTVNPAVGESQDGRARSLVAAWKLIRRRMIAEAKRDPSKRPVPSGPELDPERGRATAGVFPRQVRLTEPTVAFLAVFEEQRSGEPHLHIFVRAPWINQHWLKRQLEDLIGAHQAKVQPITDLDGAATYAAKYIAKAPRQFAGCKRYWSAGPWSQEPAPEPDPIFDQVSTYRWQMPVRQAIWQAQRLGYVEIESGRRSWTGQRLEALRPP